MRPTCNKQKLPQNSAEVIDPETDAIVDKLMAAGDGKVVRQKSDKPLDTKKELAKVAGVSRNTIAKGKPGQSLEALERKAAKQRQAAAGPKEGKGKKRSGGGKLPQAIEPTKTRDAIGRAIGMSGTTYERAKAVIASGDKIAKGKLRRAAAGVLIFSEAHNCRSHLWRIIPAAGG